MNQELEAQSRVFGKENKSQFNISCQVVKSVVTDSSVNELMIETAVGQIVEWLKWPSARNVDVWLLCFLTELAADRKFSLLVRITELNSEQVRTKSADVVRAMEQFSGIKVISLLLSFHISLSPNSYLKCAVILTLVFFSRVQNDSSFQPK